MFDPSSFANPTPVAHDDTSRDVLPKGGTIQFLGLKYRAIVTSRNDCKLAFLRGMVGILKKFLEFEKRKLQEFCETEVRFRFLVKFRVKWVTLGLGERLSVRMTPGFLKSFGTLAFQLQWVGFLKKFCEGLLGPHFENENK
ncbi:hypothetical protein TNCV_4693551 [Trichonephila clavipes]|uniref:Uncharacterized protein n=1 Tax=Trichonephila clavipes TaxID=2585209 RepID=A0A8X6WCD0_TRICX|nr:hypothetical protein TNCV_4693551 [Trichonephila clavipes]